jgi:1-acyl-sn-glycerol-3-phosphate acyltransferase
MLQSGAMTERRYPLASAKNWKQKISRRILQALGWRIDIAPLPGPRGVLIIYPHTSNWDFPIGILAQWASGVEANWLGKEALFTGWLGKIIGPILRYWGGEPVERRGSTGVIGKMAQRMTDAPYYWLAIAPEGTRRYRPAWRSGFYHIALAAKVPVGLVYLDFSKKEVGVMDFVELSGDVAVDMATIRAGYAGRIGLRPELAAPIELEQRQS